MFWDDSMCFRFSLAAGLIMSSRSASSRNPQGTPGWLKPVSGAGCEISAGVRIRDFSRSPDSRYPDQRNDGNCNSREEAVAEIRARLNKVTLPKGERVTALGV